MDLLHNLINTTSKHSNSIQTTKIMFKLFHHLLNLRCGMHLVSLMLIQWMAIRIINIKNCTVNNKVLEGQVMMTTNNQTDIKKHLQCFHKITVCQT